MINRIKNKGFQWLVIFSGFLLFFASCQKNDEVSSNSSFKLSFSTDTIIFDTIFTTIGSVTQYLKVYNRNDAKVNISEIWLAEGNLSQYQINIDGLPANNTQDVEVDAGDSLYIMVKVTVDPTDQNSPLIISDSILFNTNGNLQDVNLVAWGQDAHFIVGDQVLNGLSYKYKIIAEAGETVWWEDDKPYVVYGWAVVDSAGVLNIGPGVNVHFHQNSGLWVYKDGNIQVNGLPDSVVTFQGDRLDFDYRDLPGQWDRIWINEGSVNNVFNWTVIKNGFIGIQAETLENGTGNVLVLNNTRIENMSRWGLFTMFYNVYATNSIFANCAENTLFLSIGGLYDFRQCTFANYWSSSIRNDPSFILSNNIIVYDANGSPIIKQGDLNAYFGNCLVYGNLNEELLFSEEDGTDFIYKFDHCVLKSEMDISDENHFVNCHLNLDPLFVDYSENNYRLDTLSNIADLGSLEVVQDSQIEIELDLDGNSRTDDTAPDPGAYEYIPE
jgi:hypothetical protein